MGKIKTVVMGDIEAEEAVRQKAGVKREQKKAAKEKIEEVIEEVKEPASAEATAGKEKRKVKKIESRYRFPEGKKHVAAVSLVDPKKLYPVPEAIDLVKKTSYSKFDGSVEVHYNVTDKNLRGTVSLPHGIGKQVKVAIANDSLITNLEKDGKIDFDVLVASPDMMGKLAKVAKILGPRGLMPSPKTNTISDNPEELALSLSKGQFSWKTQPDFPIIHAVVGKVSFPNQKLEENLAAMLKSIGQDKIKSTFLKATMGPAIRIV